MGYIKEPNGVTLTVDKLKLTGEIENRIKNFISISKQKNAQLLSKLGEKCELTSDKLNDQTEL